MFRCAVELVTHCGLSSRGLAQLWSPFRRRCTRWTRAATARARLQTTVRTVRLHRPAPVSDIHGLTRVCACRSGLASDQRAAQTQRGERLAPLPKRTPGRRPSCVAVRQTHKCLATSYSPEPRRPARRCTAEKLLRPVSACFSAAASAVCPVTTCITSRVPYSRRI
jgi:hypothetical protein